MMIDDNDDDYDDDHLMIIEDASRDRRPSKVGAAGGSCE